MYYQTQMPFIFVILLFSDIGQCFHPAVKNSFCNKNSGMLDKLEQYTVL